MASAKKDVAASIRQRLLELTRTQGGVFDVTLVTYGLERLLYRLSISPHRDQFVLKGGMLVTLWTEDDNRFTRDIDFLGHGDASGDHLQAVFAEVMSIESEDGLEFDVDRLTVQTINEEQEYDGVRIKTKATLAGARIPITIDVGFGDAMTELDYEIEYPSLLDLPGAKVRSYPPATVVAEKFQAIVELGLTNSRMKDYYDLWAIAGLELITPAELDEAIKATFERRKTTIPGARPSGLTRLFYQDTVKSAQWVAYTRTIELEDLKLEAVVEAIWEFIAPSCDRLRT